MTATGSLATGADRCYRCGHTAGYHSQTQCTLSVGTTKDRPQCDCEGWRSEKVYLAEIAAGVRTPAAGQERCAYCGVDPGMDHTFLHPHAASAAVTEPEAVEALIDGLELLDCDGHRVWFQDRDAAREVISTALAAAGVRTPALCVRCRADAAWDAQELIGAAPTMPHTCTPSAGPAVDEDALARVWDAVQALRGECNLGNNDTTDRIVGAVRAALSAGAAVTPAVDQGGCAYCGADPGMDHTFLHPHTARPTNATED